MRRLAEVVTNTEVHAAFVLTNRAVSDLACDVITDDLGSIFGWVNECLANQTHSESDSNKFAIVTLLEDKDNIRELSDVKSTYLETSLWHHIHVRYGGYGVCKIPRMGQLSY